LKINSLTKVVTITLLMTFALVAPPFLATRPARNLEFVPLVQIAPDDPADATATASTAACFFAGPPPRVSAFNHCYTPAQISAAYGVDKLHAKGITGKGQTIVIVDAYGSPTAQADLDFFSDTFGLPRTTITVIHPTGTPTFNNAMQGVQVGWAVETSLDLQWAHAIAPDANLVLVASNPAETEGVQGFPSMFIGEQFAVNTYPGSVISQSFAVTEQSFHSAADVQVARFDQVYQQAVANRVTVIGSSGDTGTANVIGGHGVSPTTVLPFPTVVWPSSDPLVTSAGGTWLQSGWTWNPSAATGAGSRNFVTTPNSRTEAVWNEPYFGIATGGGRSVLFPTPSFQSGIAQSVLQGSRGLPDLSWNAAVNGGVLVFLSSTILPQFPSGRWAIIGGTSASSPQLAGLIALTNQLADATGRQHVGYLNPLLYNLPSSDFTDIVPLTFGPGGVTLNDNAQFGSGIPGMPTTSGYDLTTGFGSPKADKFVPDLAALLPPA
jgi:subtilase family serine protease